MKAKSLILAFGLLLAGANANALQKVKRVGGVEFYQIGTATELVEFAELVNGTNPGACGELTADIDYTDQTAVIGTNGAFSGEFEGNGHKITYNLTATGENFALFHEIANGSVIRNLVVDGTVTTNNKFTGTIVSMLYGSVENCISFATINTTLNGDGTHGGLIGRSWAGGSVKNCVFAGKMSGSATHSCGGIVGWAEGSTVIKNCLVAPAEWTVGTTNGFAITRNPGNALISGCYCTDVVTCDKSNATVLTAEAIASGKACFTLNGDQSTVNFYQTIGVDAAPFPFNIGHSQVFATGVNCGGADLGSAVYTNEVQEMPAHEGGSAVCPVCGLLTPNFLTPVDGFYEISNGEELKWFSLFVNTGETTANAKLTADIDMAGIDYTPAGRGVVYCGTFNGQGHKISNLIINTPGTQYVGLIGVVGGGAVVMDVVLDSTCELYGDAFIGVVGGSNGGGDVYIDRVGFEGKAQGANQNVSGIFGVNMASGATPYISNCYIAGGSVKGGRESATLSGWCGGNGYVKNCYSISTIEGCDGLGNANSPQPFCRNGKYTNCYYFAPVEQINGPVAITLEQAASGELAYLLNKEAGETVYYQTIGEDQWPVLDSTHGTVYKHGDIYNNEILNKNADGAYEIGTPEELVAFATVVNNGETSASAVLTANIDLSGVDNFTPIGLYSDESGKPNNQFVGTFDGQGYVIKNLTVTIPETESWEAGLFSRTYQATLKNFGIENATVTNNGLNGGQPIRAGIVGGELHASTVQNIFTVGELVVNTAHAQKGGISGEAHNTTLSACYTTYEKAANGAVTYNRTFEGSEANTLAPTGELCYKLNDGETYDMIYAQTLGVNEYPVLRGDNCEDLVFAAEDGSFTNEKPYWYQVKELIEQSETLAASTKGYIETGLVTRAEQLSSNVAANSWDGTVLANMLDGDFMTNFHSPIEGALATRGDYLQAALDEPVNTIKIQVRGRGDGAAVGSAWHDTPNNFTIFASNDGENWDEILTTGTLPIPNAHFADYTTEAYNLGADYTYIRLGILGSTSGNTYWNLSGFQLYKVEDDPEAPINTLAGLNTAVTLMEKEAAVKTPTVTDRTATKYDVEDMQNYIDATMATLAGTYNAADFATVRPVTSTPEDPVFFYIRNVRRNGQYANYTGNADYQSQIAADATPSLENMYYFVADGVADANGYVPVKIYNAASGGACFCDFNDWNAVGRDWYLFSNPNNDGKGLAVCKVTDINNDQCWNDNGGTAVKAWKAAGDAGSVWTFEPVMLENYPETAVFTYNHKIDGETVFTEKALAIVGQSAPAPATPVYVSAETPNAVVTGDATFDIDDTVTTPFQASTVDNPIWYNLKMREDDPGYGEYMFADFANNQIGLTAEIENDDCPYLWAFVGNPYQGYQVLNFAAGKGQYLGVGEKACMGDDAAFRWTIDSRNDQNFGLSDGTNWLNGNGGRNATWVGLYKTGPKGDVGSSMMPVLAEVPEPTFTFDPTPTNEDPESIVGTLSEFHITINDVYSVALAADAEATIENQFGPITDAAISLDGNVLTVTLDEPITSQEMAIFTLSLKGLIINAAPYNQVVYAVYYVTGNVEDGEYGKADAINSIMAQGAVDIYGVNGTLVKKAATADDLKSLKGIFVIKGKKFMLK